MGIRIPLPDTSQALGALDRMQVIHRILIGGALLLQTACTLNQSDLAGQELEVAREQLAAARSLDAARFAPAAADLAERAFVEAEAAVRRHNATLVSLWDDSLWRDKVQHASDLAQIATWVAETDRERMRREARTWMETVESLLDERATAATSVRSKVSEARRMLAEATYFLDQGDPCAALDRARGAFEIAGGAHQEVDTLLARFEDATNLKRWRSWAAEARNESRRTGGNTLVVDKLQHRALLFDRGTLQRRYEVELGHRGLYPKLVAGDGATPEGLYRVLSKKDGGDTAYHKALLLDYPNELDYERFLQAKRQGRIPAQARPGGLIEIHGDGGRGSDWTDGCVAVSNEEMDSLYRQLSVGSLVAIVGRWVDE